MTSVKNSNYKYESGDSASEMESINTKGELLRLQRHYRYLADDRKAYRNETDHTLAVQGEEIAFLLREEDDLMQYMNLCMQPINDKDDKKTLKQIAEILDEEEEIKVALSEEKDKINSHLNSIAKQEQVIEVGCYYSSMHAVQRDALGTLHIETFALPHDSC